GRAYSFADPVTGEVVDNGPHALMGAYTDALDFLREIGASAKLRVQPRLRVALAHPELGLGEVAAPAVPGPLQAPLALLRYRLLGRGDRVRLFAGALAARFALATVPLSELYTTDARRAIEAGGGTVVTGAAVASLALEGERARAVLLRDGRRVGADAVVLAVPCAALLRLLPPALRDAPPLRALAAGGPPP